MACTKCNKKFDENNCYLECSKCKLNYHISCVNVSMTLYKSMTKNSTISWTCNACSKRPALSLSNSNSSILRIDQKSPCHGTHSSTAMQNMCNICSTSVDSSANGFTCRIFHHIAHWNCADLDDLLGTAIAKYGKRILVACSGCKISKVLDLRNITTSMVKHEAKISDLEKKINLVQNSVLNFAGSKLITSSVSSPEHSSAKGSTAVHPKAASSAPVREEMEEIIK